jgi:hypothetical protein
VKRSMLPYLNWPRTDFSKNSNTDGSITTVNANKPPKKTSERKQQLSLTDLVGVFYTLIIVLQLLVKAKRDTVRSNQNKIYGHRCQSLKRIWTKVKRRGTSVRLLHRTLNILSLWFSFVVSMIVDENLSSILMSLHPVVPIILLLNSTIRCVVLQKRSEIIHDYRLHLTSSCPRSEKTITYFTGYISEARLFAIN